MSVTDTTNRQPILPRDQWHTATVDQLIDVKSRLFDYYYSAARMNPPLAAQYKALADAAEALLIQKLNPQE